MSTPRTPPRWLKCPRKGSIVADKFVPFKTPLDDRYKPQVPLEYTFTPDMLLSLLNSYNVKIGLWIDLTNTTRFYEKEEVEKKGIKYVKLQCRGHGVCPSHEQCSAFIRLCSNFVATNPTELIGVHCTHGFNRTGFLICAYLIEAMDWSVEAAVRAFTNCRQPGIYKGHYLRELFSRYGDAEDAPAAPELPDWCNEDFEDEDDEDGDDGHVNGSSNSDSWNMKDPRRRKEFMKLNPTFMQGIGGVTPVTASPKLSQVQRKVQQMCNWKSTGFPGSQPVSMDNQNLKLLSQKPYKVSWKADGTRYMMLIDGDNEVYFLDRDNAVFHAEGILFPKRKEPEKHISDTLLDGEMIIDVVNGEKHPRYLVYDIVKFEGIDVGGTDFDRRMFCINKEIIGPRETAKREGRIDGSKAPFGVRVKNFWDVTLAKNLLGEKFIKDLGHEIDGLIFQPVPDPYHPGRCDHVLKWKPHTLNSIDFKLVIVREERPGMLRENIGCLYVGGQTVPFAQMKVTRDLKQYDQKIVECTWDYEKNQWKFLRERTDKSFPNSYTTAAAVWETIKTPVTRDKLLEHIELYRWQPPNQKRSQPQAHGHPSLNERPGDQDRSLMPPPNKIPRR